MANIAPRIPIIGGVPSPLPPVFSTDPATLGVTLNPPQQRVYISTQGDWWDLISLRCYGMRRGDDHLMHKLIEANYEIKHICKFPAGIPVIVPDITVKTSIPLVPWKRASLITPGTAVTPTPPVVAPTTPVIVGAIGGAGTPGAAGAPGRRGSLWFTGTTNPTVIPGAMDQDLYLNTVTGGVFEFAGGVWRQK